MNLFKLSYLNTILNDAPEPWQIGFQDSAAPSFSGIVELHNTLFFYLIIIVVGVFWVLWSILINFNSTISGIAHKYLNHGILLMCLLISVIIYKPIKLTIYIFIFSTQLIPYQACGRISLWPFSIIDN